MHYWNKIRDTDGVKDILKEPLSGGPSFESSSSTQVNNSLDIDYSHSIPRSASLEALKDLFLPSPPRQASPVGYFLDTRILGLSIPGPKYTKRRNTYNKIQRGIKRGDSDQEPPYVCFFCEAEQAFNLHFWPRNNVLQATVK
jgi:hypothetical protein